MKHPRILDRVPLPLNRNEVVWRDWCTKISDEMVDCFQCLQKNTVFSDALYSTIMTVIYKIPGQTFGIVIDEILLYDILYKAVDLQGFETCKKLVALSKNNTFYRLSLLSEFKSELDRHGIEAAAWCKSLDIQAIPIVYWVNIGVAIPIEYERIVKEWLLLQAPWPIIGDTKTYLKQVYFYEHMESEDENYE